MLICICVYIYKYISTDLLLEYLQQSKEGDKSFRPKLFHDSEFYYWEGFFCFFRPWLYKNQSLINQQNRSSSELKGTSFFLGSLWDLRKREKKKKKKKKEQEEKKQKIMGEEKKIKVKTLNPPKCMCCLAIVCSKSVIRKKLSLWHNHCFLCCIDSKMFKWKKKRKRNKKKTLGKKIYFCTKVILSLACVLCSFPLSSVGRHIRCGKKLIQQDNFQIENFLKRWEELVGFGTLVTVSPLLCHFQPVAAKDGNVFFHYIFVYF